MDSTPLARITEQNWRSVDPCKWVIIGGRLTGGGNLAEG